MEEEGLVFNTELDNGDYIRSIDEMIRATERLNDFLDGVSTDNIQEQFNRLSKEVVSLDEALAGLKERHKELSAANIGDLGLSQSGLRSELADVANEIAKVAQQSKELHGALELLKGRMPQQNEVNVKMVFDKDDLAEYALIKDRLKDTTAELGVSIAEKDLQKMSELAARCIEIMESMRGMESMAKDVSKSFESLLSDKLPDFSEKLFEGAQGLESQMERINDIRSQLSEVRFKLNESRTNGDDTQSAGYISKEIELVDTLEKETRKYRELKKEQDEAKDALRELHDLAAGFMSSGSPVWVTEGQMGQIEALREKIKGLKDELDSASEESRRFDLAGKLTEELQRLQQLETEVFGDSRDDVEKTFQPYLDAAAKVIALADNFEELTLKSENARVAMREVAEQIESSSASDADNISDLNEQFDRQCEILRQSRSEIEAVVSQFAQMKKVVDDLRNANADSTQPTPSAISSQLDDYENMLSRLKVMLSECMDDEQAQAIRTRIRIVSDEIRKLRESASGLGQEMGQELPSQIAKASDSLAAMEAKVSELQAKVEALAKSFMSARDKVEDLRQSNAGAQEMENASRACEEYAEKLRKANEELAALQGRQNGLVHDEPVGQSPQQAPSRPLAETSFETEIKVNIKADNTDFRKSNDEVVRGLAKTVSQLQSMQYEVDRAKDALERFAEISIPAFSVAGITAFLNKVKNVRANFQDIESTMKVFLGNEEKALEFVGELEKAAYYNMFDFSQLVEGSKQMIAYGVATEQVIPRINQLSEIATATHSSLGEMVSMYNRAKSLGFVDSRSMQSWATKGLVIKDVLKEMGENANSTRISFEKFNKVLDHVTEEGGMFHGVMDAQMQNISAEIGQLEDNWSLMCNSIGKEIEKPLTDVVHWASELVGEWEKVAWAMGGAAAAGAVYHKSMQMTAGSARDEISEIEEKVEQLERTAADLPLDKKIQRRLDAGLISSDEADTWQKGLNRLRKEGKEDVSLKQIKAEADRRIELTEKIKEETRALKELHDEAAKGFKKEEEMTLDDDLKDAVANGVKREDAEALQKNRDWLAKTEADWSEKDNNLTKQIEDEKIRLELLNLDAEALEEAKNITEQTLKATESKLGLEKMSSEEKKDYLALLREQLQDESLGDDDAVGDNEHIISKKDALGLLADAENAERVVTEASTNAEEINTSQRKISTLTAQQQTTQEKLSELQKRKTEMETKKQAAAENAATASKQRGAVASALLSAKDAIATTSKKLWANATNQVTTSIRGLGAAIMANPIGMLITGITMAISLFQMFKKETEDVDERVETFGESALKTRSNVETLYSVLSTVDPNSKVYSDSLKELTKIAKEHGITIEDESKAYETLLKKRGELITLIMEEGRQRQIANNIAKYQKEGQEATEEATGKLKDILQNYNDGLDDKQASVLADIIAGKAQERAEEYGALEKRALELNEEAKKVNEQVKNHKDRLAALNKINEERKELRARMDKISAEILADVNKTAKNINGGSDLGGTAHINEQMRKLAKTSNDTKAAIDEYSNAMTDSQNSTVGLGKATEDLSNKSMGDLIKGYLKVREESETLQEKLKGLGDTGEDVFALLVKGIDETNKSEDKAKGKSAELEAALKRLNLKAVPKIDTKWLDLALGKANQLKNVIRNLNGDELHFDTETAQRLQEIMDKYNGGAPLTSKVKKPEDVSVAEWNEDIRYWNENYKQGLRQSYMNVGLTDDKTTQVHFDATRAALWGQIQEVGKNERGVFDPKKLIGTEWEPIYNELTEYAQKTAWATAIKDDKSMMDEYAKLWESKIVAGESDEYYSSLLQDVNEQLKSLRHDDPLYKRLKSVKERLEALNDKSDKELQRFNAAEAERKEKERKDKMEKQAAQESRRTEILKMHDDTNKERTSEDFEYEVRQDSLEDKWKAESRNLYEKERSIWMTQNPKQNKIYRFKGYDESEYMEQAKMLTGYTAAIEKIAYEHLKKIDEINEKERKSMLAYVKEYGSLKEKELAISEDYDKRIEDATTDGERKMLERNKTKELAELRSSYTDGLRDFIAEIGEWQDKRDRAEEVMKRDLEKAGDNLSERVRIMKEYHDKISEIDMEELKEGINWEVVFGDLDSLSQKTLDGLREKLVKALDAKDITAENAKVIMDQINAIDASLEDRKSIWSNFFSVDAIDNYNIRVRRAKQADSDVERLTGIRDRQEQDRDLLRQQLSERLVSMGARDKDGELPTADKLDLKTAQEMINGVGDESGKLKTVFDQLAKAEGELSTTSKDLETAQAKQKISQESLKKSLWDYADIIGGVTEKIGMNIGSLSELMGKLGIGEDTALGSGLSSLSGGINSAANAFASFSSGDYIGAVSSAFDALVSFGDALGAFGIAGFGTSDRTLARDMERLARTNEALREAIDNLYDELSDSRFSDAADVYKELKTDIEEMMNGTREMMLRNASVYSNGFLGIGGNKSVNAHVDKVMTDADWARVSAKAGVTVKDSGDFFALTSEQMGQIATHAADLWAKIQKGAEKGKGEVADYMNEFKDYWEQLEEAADAFNQKMTGTSFDSVASEFSSMLLDMDSDIDDFSESFENKMRQAVISSMFSDLFENRIREWYDEWAALMDEGLDDEEQAKLQGQWKALAAEALEQRDAISEAMGWGRSGSQKGTTSGGFATASQDSVDELNGRFTAVQIETSAIRLAVDSINAMTIQNTDTFTRINEGVAFCRMYGQQQLEELVQIRKNTAHLEEIADKIDKIEEHVQYI